jgi:SAM-dependent methyltransferase
VLDSGALVFDGPVAGGLVEYAALATRHGEVLPGTDTRPAPEAVEPWHHVVMGGAWEEMGDWAIEFLQREGLAHEQFVLDAGCGSLAAARTLLPFMQPGHYWGYDMSRELFNAGVMLELVPRGIDPARGHFLINDQFDVHESPNLFDIALAHSLLPRLLEEQVGHCLTGVLQHVRPGGRFYLAVGARGPGDVRSPMGDLVARLADALGVRVETRPEAGHPRGDEMMVLVKS